VWRGRVKATTPELGNGLMSNIWTGFGNWLKKPFSADMDAFHWFLFFGLLILISVGWTFVLRHLARGIE
jgi:hypothetical protein